MAEDMRTVRLGVDKKYLDMIESVLGQLSDGYWENTPRMRGYWLFAHAKAQGNECVLEIDPVRWGTRHGYSNVTNQWLDMSDAKVKQFLADKIKFLVKEEGLDWNRGNENTTDYLSYTQPYFKVKDCYYVYELLKGRNVSKHPEYSEAFYAKKNGKEFQIEIELVDGPNAEDPDKITVIVGDKSTTVDVPKDGTEDHYRKAVAAGLKKLGYEMGEGKPADEANEAGRIYYVSVDGLQGNKLLPVQYALSIAYQVEVQARSEDEAKAKAIKSVQDIYTKFGIQDAKLVAAGISEG